MGKRHSSRQDVLLLTETGDIADGKLDAAEGYVASPDTLEAWELDFSQQCKDVKTGRMCQVISERHKKPLSVFKNRPTLIGSSTDVIASRMQDRELAFMNSHREKNKMLLWVGIIAALLAVVISIVVLVRLNKEPEAAQTLFPTVLAISLPAILSRTKKTQSIQKEDDFQTLYPPDEKELIQCIVIVEKTGEKTYPKIAKALIPEDSLERNYKGVPCHLLGLTKDGVLWAIEPENEIKINESPKDCFLALDYENEVTAVFGLSEGAVEKIKIGLFIGLCIAELIILFLIITTIGG